MLKDHPFRKLALELRKVPAPPRILGLTASLTYAVTQLKIKKDVARICEELQVKHLPYVTEEELRQDGYTALGTKAEVLPYQVPSAFTASSGVVPVEQRKPHAMLTTFQARVDAGVCTALSKALAACIKGMEDVVAGEDASFSSPLKRVAVKEWGKYAHGRAAACSGQCAVHYAQLEHWYEAMRVLVVSWEEAEDTAVTLLRMTRQDDSEASSSKAWPDSMCEKLRSFWAQAPTEFPRFEHLKGVLRERHGSSQRAFRGILFVEQRVTTHVLQHYIRTDSELQPLFTTACLYATASPATASLSVTRSQAASMLKAFSDGSVNLLITTVVAEEGMDVPAANCSIRFDSMVNSISFVKKAESEQSLEKNVLRVPPAVVISSF